MAGSGWLGCALAPLLRQPSTAGWPAQTGHLEKKSQMHVDCKSSGPGGTFCRLSLSHIVAAGSVLVEPALWLGADFLFSFVSMLVFFLLGCVL
jgi:hypothetical protein